MTNSASDQNEDVVLETVPPELQPLHERLETDGGSWRDSLPPTDSLLRRMPLLPPSAPPSGGMLFQASDASGTDNTGDPGDSGSVSIPGAALRPELLARRASTLVQSPLRGVAAGVAVVAIISLFALLLHSFSTSKGVAPLASTADSSVLSQAPTAAPLQGQWRTVDAMTYHTTVFTQTPYPVFSPMNPAIVYETTLAPISLRRSENGGATWVALALPSGSDQAIDIEIFASPLDARAAFLTITMNLAYGQGTDGCPSSARSASVGGTGGNILASGQVPCSTTYRTTNAGASWRAITFPVNGTISTPFSDSAPYAGAPIQAQGSWLYALLDCGPTCVSPGGRLVTSGDGGVSWQVADAGGLGQGVCDFAAQPNNHTIFAAVSRGSCDALNSPTIAIDRSDDAGNNWAHVSFLPQGAVQGMASVVIGGKPLLVVNIPAVSWQPHIINVTQSPTEYRVSADGGKTWKVSPARGVPANAKPVVAPLSIRADGSLVAAFSASGDGANARVYSWRPGEASWRMFAPAPGGQLATLLRTASSTDGEALWAVVRGEISSTGVFTFTIAKYPG